MTQVSPDKTLPFVETVVEWNLQNCEFRLIFMSAMSKNLKMDHLNR